MLSVAVSSLQMFVQLNWLGPPCTDFKTFYLPAEFTTSGKQVNSKIKFVDILLP